MRRSANFWRLAPVGLSAVLLAAHFSRAGQPWLVVVSLAFPFVLLVRDGRAVRVVQVALLLGGLEWVRTLWRLADRRMELGQPWLRMALILGGVAAFTWASALVFRSPRLRRIWFAHGPADERDESPAASSGSATG